MKKIVSKVKTSKAKAVKAVKGKAARPKSRVFKFHSPSANRVSVAGDFNNWDPGSLMAKKDSKGNWSVKVNLLPGRYEYKFFVDGSWMADPATDKVWNIYGSENSVIEIE